MIPLTCGPTVIPSDTMSVLKENYTISTSWAKEQYLSHYLSQQIYKITVVDELVIQFRFQDLQNLNIRTKELSFYNIQC